MSKWHDMLKGDITFSDDGEEMHIYIESDYNGAIYVSVKTKDVKERLKELKKTIKENTYGENDTQQKEATG